MSPTPRLDDYLARLPDGLASYPDHLAKASLLRAVLNARGPGPFSAELPRELSELLHDPPLASRWIPEVHYVAAHFAIADADGISNEDMIAITYRANRALTGSRMYRALARVGTPSLLLRGAVAGWGLIHRGVRLSVDAEPNRAELRLRHAPHLYPELAHVSAAEGFRAVIEAAHGSSVEARVLESRAGGADVAVVWH